MFFYIGFTAGTVLCGLAHTYVILVVARIITGLFGGVISSIAMAIITDLFALQQRGRVMGFTQMGFGASQVLGIPLGLYLANHWGWEIPFFLTAGLAGLIVLTIVLKLKPVTAHLAVQHDKSAFVHLWHTVSRQDYRVGFAATALMSIGGFMMMPFGSAFAINNLGVTNQQLPVLFMISGVSSLVIMPLVGRLSDKISKFKLFAMASVWTMIMCILYTNLSVTPFYLVVILNILLMMGVLSRMVPQQALISAVPDMEDRGAFMSINASLQQIAGGIAAAAAGMIVIQKTKFSPLEHYNTVGYVIVVISVCSILLLGQVNRLIGRKMKSRAPIATKDEVVISEGI